MPPARAAAPQDVDADADAMARLAADLERLGRDAGLAAVGIASAHPFENTRATLVARKQAGLHGGMHFTYGNPERSTDPSRTVPGARALVVGARSYRRARPERPAAPDPAAAAPGQVARYAWRDEYAPLRTALGVIADRLVAAGWAARVLVDDNALVDREAAFRAGLGWYGKNANLLLPGQGSWFVLGAVVTDAPLPAAAPPPSPASRGEGHGDADAEDEPDAAADADADSGSTAPATGCGTCTRCIPACPTGAIVAPGVVDARRCLAWLLQAPGSFPVELRAALGGRVYGCDDCQDACPPNRLADRHDPPPALEGDEAWVDLVAMLDLGDDELLARFGRWYVARRQARYLRRNALVALGNVGDPGHPGVARVLAKALADGDPIVREHAAWAAERLGRADLAPRP